MQTVRSTTKFSHKKAFSKVVSWLLLLVGALSLILSVIFVSSILAFIGLGLLFWGAILLYVTPEEYVKSSLLNAVTMTLLANVEKILEDGNYKGKAVYLPPKYLKDFESSKVFLSTENAAQLPSPEQIQQKETEKLLSNPNYTLITPPGADMVRLFESILETSFTKVNLTYIETNLPKLLLEDLEIAENIEIETKEKKIQVKIQNSVQRNYSTELKRFTYAINLLGCPISSAIACALAKATGKPIEIEKYSISEDGKTTIIEYRLLEEAQKEQT